MLRPTSPDLSEAQLAGHRLACRGMRDGDRLTRDEQLVAGVTDDRQRHRRTVRVCVSCEGPRGSFPVCDGCSGGGLGA